MGVQSGSELGLVSVPRAAPAAQTSPCGLSEAGLEQAFDFLPLLAGGLDG